jgi:hypothetical protein
VESDFRVVAGLLLGRRRRGSRGSPGTEERVVNVAGDGQLHAGQPWIESRQVGRCRVAIDGRTEAAEQARPAVRRGAPADPEHDRADAGIERRADHLAGPDRAGRDGVALRGGDPRQPRRFRHLDHGALPVR